MQIEIVVKDDEGEVIIKRTSLSWEGADEDFGKLERWWKSQEYEDKELAEQ